MTMSPWVTHIGVAVYDRCRRPLLAAHRCRCPPENRDVVGRRVDSPGHGPGHGGMFDRSFALAPPRVWLAFFGVAGAWFVLRGSLAARRQLSGQLVGGTLVHVGGCAAMAYMLMVVPPSGNMVNMADLICGARMIGMQATASGSLVTPWTGPAIAIVVVLLSGAACATWPRFRACESGPSVEYGILQSGRPSSPPTIDSGRLGCPGDDVPRHDGDAHRHVPIEPP